MLQCYYIVVLMVYSAPLVIESTPIHKDTSMPQPDPLARKPPKPPFLPEFHGPWTRRTQWLLLFLQILLMGILAGLILSVMGVDKMRLRVWAKTGGEKQRSILDLHISMLRLTVSEGNMRREFFRFEVVRTGFSLL